MDLFDRLREAGLPLGVGEYKLLLEALKAGFGLPDWSSLHRLCTLLWTKSRDEARLLDWHFGQCMSRPIQVPSELTPSDNRSDSMERAASPQAIAANDHGPETSRAALPPVQSDEVQVVQTA